MLFGHCLLLFDLLDYDNSKIVERVIGRPKVLIDLDRVGSLHVIPVLVDPSVGLLRLKFSNVLLAIVTPVTPGQVNRVFRPATDFLTYFELLTTGTISEYLRIHDVSTTEGISPSTAGDTSAGWLLVGPDDLSSS